MIQAPTNTGAVRTLLDKAITTFENISSVVIFIMMILTFADVIGRYVFHKPIYGGTEIISALLALAIFSGLAVTNARDEHIMVELFEETPRRIFGPFVYEVIIQLFSVTAMGIIAFVLFESAIESYMLNSRTVVLEMPLYYISGSISFLAILSVVSQIVGVVLKIVNMRNTARPDL